MHHLYVGRLPAPCAQKVSPGIPAPDGLCESKSMQSLAYVKADPSFVSNVGKVNQLIKFGITDVKEEHGQDLCLWIKKMSHLGI